MGNQNVSSVILEKLLPGEIVINQYKARIDLVATDKRLLRFTNTDFRALEYSNISAIKRGTYTGKKLVVRGIITLCTIFLMSLGIGVLVDGISGSSRNNNALTGGIFFLVCLGVAAPSMWFAYSFGYNYYQIEGPKIDGNSSKIWRIAVPAWGRSRVKSFIESIEKQIKSTS